MLKLRNTKGLLPICTYQNRFQVDGKYFEQTQGTAIGNLLSPFIWNFFLSNTSTQTITVIGHTIHCLVSGLKPRPAATAG